MLWQGGAAYLLFTGMPKRVQWRRHLPTLRQIIKILMLYTRFAVVVMIFYEDFVLLSYDMLLSEWTENTIFAR